MDEYIRIKNKHKKHRKISIEEKKETPKQNLIFLWMIKLLVTILLTLLTLILLKQNQVYKKNFHKYVFEDHFNFTKINEMYKKIINIYNIIFKIIKHFKNYTSKIL